MRVKQPFKANRRGRRAQRPDADTRNRPRTRPGAAKSRPTIPQYTEYIEYLCSWKILARDLHQVGYTSLDPGTTMKTEQILMSILFVACTALVVGSLAVMLGADVQPVQLAQSSLKTLPQAAFGLR